MRRSPRRIAHAFPRDRVNAVTTRILTLEKAMNTSSEGLTQETLPGGIVKVNLQGRFATTMVATKDANGKVVVPCLTNENDVKAFEKTSAAPTAARKE